VLPRVNLVHPHLLQRGLWRAGPTLDVAHIDRSHRGLRQLKSPRHLEACCTLAGLADNLFEPIAKRCLREQLLDLFHSYFAFRTSQPMDFHHHRRRANAPGRTGFLAPDHVKYLVQPQPASPTLKSAMDRLAPHPRLKVDRYRQRSGLSWTLLKRSDTQSALGDRGCRNQPSLSQT
jgi:hypothetical protein